ncbi:MAG: glycoside hydrolase family 18 protein [Salinivirgaceae bacterium]|nr:glycoside hydrolase family 18 protein [Salinivirgaceae bacterium]
MNKVNFIIGLALVFCFGCSGNHKDESQSEAKTPKRIIAYVAGWASFDISTIEAKKITHINYAFANIVNGEVQFELDNDSVNIQKLIKLKNINPDLKLLYSIGGWVWSDQFSNVAVSHDSRNKFAKSAVKLMQKYQFDGIDLDWEYPGQRAEDNIYRPSDKENFTLLLKELREQLNALSNETNKTYLLTIATGANQLYIDNTDLGEAQKHLDFINIMTYDFYHGWHYQTGHHANLHPSKKEMFGGNSVVESVDRHLNAGVPKDKLVVGIPFYGRKWDGVLPTENGLYQPAKTAGIIIDYKDIKDSLATGDFVRFWDESACAPYAWNKNSNSFISYDDGESLALKIDYIKENNLGGVMFWEYSQDLKGELLNTINAKY